MRLPARASVLALPVLLVALLVAAHDTPGGGAQLSGGQTSAAQLGGTEVGRTQVGGPAVATVTEAPDYASEAFADPWDYANAADEHVGTPQMSHGGTIRGGLLTWTTATAFPWMDPVPYLPGSMPLERDGPSAPIDTRRYTSVSIRMHASQPGPGALVWATCDWSRNAACQGATNFAVKQGWHTYEVPLVPTDRNLRAPWTGRALRLRFLPTNRTGTVVTVDWMRLHGAAAPVPFSLSPAAPGQRNEVLWDADTDLSNNTPDNPGWGPVGTTTSASADFPVASYPPGTYRLYTRSGDRTGPYTAPLRILPRPRPVIDSPSLAGGADYATTARRGDGWDFTSLGDVGRTGNVCGARILTGGVLAGTNCGREIDNPFLFLPNPGPIDGNRWHRLTVRLRYDGPFGLMGGPTGGAVARLIWYVEGAPGADQNVHDLVVYPGWQTITVDLKTNPPYAVVDETQKARRVGWAGQRITALRLDPNEDVSARRWYVDFVRLTQVDSGRGRFLLRFRETAGLPGQTAQVFLDRDRTGGNGTRVATAPVVAGANAVPMVLPPSLAPGRYWPYVVISGPYGTSTRYASSPVDFTR